MKENFNFLKTIYFFYSLEMSSNFLPLSEASLPKAEQSKKTLKRTQSTTKIKSSTDEPTSRKEPKAEPSNFLLLSEATLPKTEQRLIMIQDINEPKEEKPKRKLSEKQLEALARGRAKNPRFHPKV